MSIFQSIYVSADHLADFDARVLRSFAQPFESRLRARSLPNLRVGLYHFISFFPSLRSIHLFICHLDVGRDIPDRHLLKDDCLYSEAACRYSAVCNILKLSFVFTNLKQVYLLFFAGWAYLFMLIFCLSKLFVVALYPQLCDFICLIPGGLRTSGNLNERLNVSLYP